MDIPCSEGKCILLPLVNKVESPFKVQVKIYFTACSPDVASTTDKLYSCARFVEHVAPSIFFPCSKSQKKQKPISQVLNKQPVGTHSRRDYFALFL